MKSFGTALFAWFVPGGAYLLSRRYLQFAIALAIVCGATIGGVALHGTNLWPQASELQGLDGFTSGLAQAGAAVRTLAGAPYFLSQLGSNARDFLSGQTHEYGTTLLVLAGLFNLLALADGLELRKADRA